MDDDIIVTLKRSNDLLMTFGNDYSDVFLPAIDKIERLQEALVEAEAELIYLRRHGKDGARWEANESKDVWRDFARKALKEKE